MHELGVVFYIIKDVKEAAISNNVKKVSAVTLSLGEVSTIISSYLQDCWKWAVSKEEIMKNAVLKIEKIPAITHCVGCGKNYNTVEFGKVCPHCGSDNTFLVQGNEVEIKEIETY